MNKEFVYKTLKPIFVFIVIYFFGLIFKIVPGWLLFRGQVSIIYLILVLFVMKFASKPSFKMYGFTRTTLKNYLIALFITSIFVFLCILINFYYLRVYPGDGEGSSSLILIVLTSLILGPFVEELICRGYLQTNLAHLKHKGIRLFNIFINLPIIVPALIFGLAHFSVLTKGASFPYIFYLIITAFFFGIISGYFREKSGSIYPSIVIHSFANLLNPILSSIFLRMLYGYMLLILLN